MLATFPLRVDLLSQSRLYVDCELDLVWRQVLVDTISFIRVGLLNGEDRGCLGAAEHETLQITTVTGEQVTMQEKGQCV